MYGNAIIHRMDRANVESDNGLHKDFAGLQELLHRGYGAARLHAMGAPGYENEFKPTLHAQRLEQPVKRKKPTVYFVNSMSDLFHDEVPDEFLDQIFG
jgi:hypothetical protein